MSRVDLVTAAHDVVTVCSVDDSDYAASLWVCRSGSCADPDAQQGVQVLLMLEQVRELRNCLFEIAGLS